MNPKSVGSVIGVHIVKSILGWRNCSIVKRGWLTAGVAPIHLNEKGRVMTTNNSHQLSSMPWGIDRCKGCGSWVWELDGCVTCYVLEFSGRGAVPQFKSIA